MRILWCLLFLFLGLGGFAQEKTIHFVPFWGHEKLTLNQGYYDSLLRDSVTFQSLRFYISKVCFYKNGQEVLKEKHSFHLMDIEDKMSFTVAAKQAIDAVVFQIGIDSITNVSGVMGGDLDPTLGMYWTWQSGYINFKIEGKSPVCPTRNHVFQWHIGGYRFPDASIQAVQLSCSNKNDIYIGLDLQQVFNQVSLKEKPEVMSPGKEAVHISSLFSNCFFGVNE